MPRRPTPLSHVATQSPYEVPSFVGPIDLHLEGNEGSLLPPDWTEALSDPDVVRRYPGGNALDRHIAAGFSVPVESVLVTAGADDALDRVFRAMLAPGQEVLLPTPTFEMIERFARLAGGTVVSIPWMDGDFPVEQFRSRVSDRTGVVGVVTPNNPTGLAIPFQVLQKLSELAPHAVLLVDMAYGEFADDDISRQVLSLPNAVMIRTLSKAWGFAGLRIGYAIGPPDLIAGMRVAGPPYPLAGPSIALAIHRFEHQRSDVDAFVTRVKSERQALETQLKALGAAPWPSQANFVLARFKDPHWVWQGLGGLGIAVRPFPGRPHLGDTLRITCPGEDASFRRLQAALQAVMAPEAILFDMDGVLADVSQSYRKAIIDTAAKFDVPVTGADIAEAKARGGANNDWELTWRLITSRGGQARLEDVTRHFEELYQGGLWQEERFLWERQALTGLSQRLPLGIVTGRPRRDAVRFLEAHGVRDVFRTIVCMEDGPLKPDPAPVRRALDDLGVRYAWMVGDTPDDLVAARRAGVVPLGICPPQEDCSTVLRQAGAARVLSSLEELLKLLP